MDKWNKAAKEFIDSFKGSYGIPCEPFSEELELNLIAGISMMLREQDRDTRHACCEAIRESAAGNGRINTNQACGACINNPDKPT